jgi:putative transposase
MDKAGLIRSISRKGCTPDNLACERFFGRLKNEMFYYRSWQGVSITQFMNELVAILGGIMKSASRYHWEP